MFPAIARIYSRLCVHCSLSIVRLKTNTITKDCPPDYTVSMCLVQAVCRFFMHSRTSYAGVTNSFNSIVKLKRDVFGSPLNAPVCLIVGGTLTFSTALPGGDRGFILAPLT